MNEFSLKIKSLNGNFTTQRKAKFEQAVKLVTQFFKSEEFRVWFIEQATAKKFKQLTQRQTTLTPAELYMMTQVHIELDYWIKKKPWWKRFTSVMGWTVDDDITTYADVYDGMSLAGLTAHLAHEISHLMGYSHSVEWVPARDYSVSYLIGNWFEAKVRSVK